MSKATENPGAKIAEATRAFSAAMQIAAESAAKRITAFIEASKPRQ